MPLKTIATLPPGGWIYTQKETKWKLQDMGPFNAAAVMIANHRKANNLPRASISEAARDLNDATCERLGQDPIWCIDDSKKNFFNPAVLFQAAKSHVQLAANASAKFASGGRVLYDWLGQGGKPVPADESQGRADICLHAKEGNPCPHNQTGVGFDEFTGPIAESIKEQLEVKHQMHITVAGEENLHTCALCWCHLALKVHTPLDIILERTPMAMLKTFERDAPWCWMNKPPTPA